MNQKPLYKFIFNVLSNKINSIADGIFIDNVTIKKQLISFMATYDDIRKNLYISIVKSNQMSSVHIKKIGENNYKHTTFNTENLNMELIFQQIIIKHI